MQKKILYSFIPPRSRCQSWSPSHLASRCANDLASGSLIQNVILMHCDCDYDCATLIWISTLIWIDCDYD